LQDVQLGTASAARLTLLYGGWAGTIGSLDFDLTSSHRRLSPLPRAPALRPDGGPPYSRRGTLQSLVKITGCKWGWWGPVPGRPCPNLGVRLSSTTPNKMSDSRGSAEFVPHRRATAIFQAARRRDGPASRMLRRRGRAVPAAQTGGH
jgi:hypothetical protein